MYRRKGAKRTYRKKQSKKITRPTVSKSIKKYVNATIHKNIENKIQNFNEDFSFSSVNSDPTMSVAPITPQSSQPSGIRISQGVGAGDRTGNSIRTRKVIFRYSITPQPYDENFVPYPQPVWVRMYFGYIRGCRDVAPTAGQLSNFFQAGNVSEPFAGNLTDMVRPYNKDLFHVCCMRTHKIGNAFITKNRTTPSAVDEQNYSNNDFKLNALGSVDLTKYIPKTMKFNDANDNPDTGLYVWFNSVYASGNFTTDNIAQTRCFYSIDYEYEDA